MKRECDGCGAPADEGDLGTIWIAAPIGLTTAKVHRVAECSRAAVAAHGPEAERVGRPLTKEEKLRA